MMTRMHIAGLAALCSAAGCGTAAEPSSSLDGRTPLPVPVEAADAVRAEMRTMLGSLNGILKALPEGDTAALRSAALASGMAAAADTALEHVLPEEFLHLGISVHTQFDTLGAALAAGMSPDSVVPRLARITSDCVACHSRYRLQVSASR